jgi:hypothetical protein
MTIAIGSTASLVAFLEMYVRIRADNSPGVAKRSRYGSKRYPQSDISVIDLEIERATPASRQK